MANRLTQIAVESLEASGNPRVRLTQIAVEVLTQGVGTVPPPATRARLTQIAVEVLARTAPLPPPNCPGSERGNIDYDQIQLAARHGNAAQFQMSDGTGVAGNLAVFDQCGNLTDSGRARGGASALVTAPASSSSMGIPGMFATDQDGNVYFCYSANAWLRIGPSGYSNTF